MRRTAVIITFCVLVVILAGCTGSGGLPDSDWGFGGSETPTPIPDCITLDKGDPNIPECLITVHPADLRVENYDSDRHNVTVRVVRNGSTEVLSERESLGIGHTRYVVFEDVFDHPGTYTITATVDNSSTATATWNASKRYSGEGGAEWKISINGTEDVSVRRIYTG